MIDVEIRTFEAIHVARIRHVGPYADVGPCFDRLFRWAASGSVATGRVLMLSYDDPDRVPTDKLRSDACVEMRTTESPPPGIETADVGAGRYAVYRHHGPYEGLADAYGRLLHEWLPGSGETVADWPCMELYRNSPMDTPARNLVTDVCVPLRAS